MKLNSQTHPEGKTDWRKIPSEALVIEPYALPLELHQKIHRFMKKMGLVFGAMDFIVTEDGQYIFLEINEQGQFLWIEDNNPAFEMLDVFVNFLINKSIKYQWDPKKSRHYMREYVDEVKQLVIENLQNHVSLSSY